MLCHLSAAFSTHTLNGTQLGIFVGSPIGTQ